jgi:hypothetical protein
VQLPAASCRSNHDEKEMVFVVYLSNRCSPRVQCAKILHFGVRVETSNQPGLMVFTIKLSANFRHIGRVQPISEKYSIFVSTSDNGAFSRRASETIWPTETPSLPDLRRMVPSDDAYCK